MQQFLRSLWASTRAHPVAAVLTLLAIVVVLGGLVWKLLGFVFGLLAKVPGGDNVEKVVRKVAETTGSAALFLLPAGALLASGFLQHGATLAPFIG